MILNSARLVLAACLLWAAPSYAAPEEKPTLVFKTGFEGDSRVIPSTGSDDQLVGNDKTQGALSEIGRHLGIESFALQYTGGTPAQRFAKVIPEPGNPANHVLQFWMNDAWPASENQVKARVQANFYRFPSGYREFYQTARVYLHPDMAALRAYPKPILWLTLAEFWNDRYWGGDKHGFRITVGIGKPTAETSDLTFILDAQGPGTTPLWKAHNDRVKVPLGRWFTIHYYVKEGDRKTGRFQLAIQPDGGRFQVVSDVTNWTYCPTDPAPDGMRDWNPLKLYTSKELVAFMKARDKPLQIYWDDVELWTGRRPTAPAPDFKSGSN